MLYKNRDTVEAQRFMDKLTSFMRLTPGQKLLDLGCGKGRHSIYLNKRGYDVHGVDLSPKSIEFAQQYANEQLHFAVHDMRKPYLNAQFDVVLNLFTSFGFFEADEEHQATITGVAQSLKPEGYFVIDFLNTCLVKNVLIKENKERRGDIEFYLKRYLENDFIVKDIYFEDQGQSFYFQERVKALQTQDFRRYLSEAGFNVLHLFGNYDLDFYEPHASERMIFIAQKAP